MNFLAMVPLRWWLYLGTAAAVAGVLWHDHHQTHRANAAVAEKRLVIAERDQALATIETLKVDAALNKETSHALAERLQAVDRDRREHPFSLRCRASAASAVPAEGRAAAGADDAAAGPVDEAPLRDLGPALADGWQDCVATGERLKALQAWEDSRSH
jgi:hypothetical protein